MTIRPTDYGFYDRDAAEVARSLLGKTLMRRTPQGLVAGRIVETEAYLPQNDPACHASRGMTRKNATMFAPAGRAYVYSIHARFCFNIVTQPEGVPGAVLIRAVEPLLGIEQMQRRRGKLRDIDLTTGPAKLCEAFAIDRRLDGWDLTRGSRLWVADGTAFMAGGNVGRSVRIGVREPVPLPLRFYLRGNPFVSGPKRLRR